MNAEVKSVSASVKLHYELTEDLIYWGARGVTEDIFMNEWALGTRKDVMEAAIKVLSMAKDDETIIIGIVPNFRPPSEKPQEPAESVVGRSGVYDHQNEG